MIPWQPMGESNVIRPHPRDHQTVLWWCWNLSLFHYRQSWLTGSLYSAAEDHFHYLRYTSSVLACLTSAGRPPHPACVQNHNVQSTALWLSQVECPTGRVSRHTALRVTGGYHDRQTMECWWGVFSNTFSSPFLLLQLSSSSPCSLQTLTCYHSDYCHVHS